MPNDLLEAALQYAARGWHAFPLRPRSKMPAIAKKDGGRGFLDATTDPATIEAWWGRWPAANIGLATGASGLVVLDPDGPEGLAQLRVVSGGVLPRTLVARTGRVDGFHLYYAGTGVRSSQVKGEHLDVRGSTGYVVAPPSVHPSGAIYAWVVAGTLVLPVPAWVAPWVDGRKAAPSSLVPMLGEEGVARGTAASEAKPRRGLAETGAVAQEPYSADAAARLRSALAAIPADLDGATWFSYGAALHDLKWIVNGQDQGLEIWDEWSSTSQGQGAGNGEYRGRADLEKRWASFNREYQGRKTSLGSIFKAARDAGWGQVVASATPGQNTDTNGHAAADALIPAAVFASPIRFPDTDQWGRPKATCRNARAAIRHLGVACEHDTFHDRLHLGGQAVEQWAGELTDHSVHMLRVLIDRRYGLDCGPQHTFDAAVQECLLKPVDPVADYLASVQKGWDGKSRLRTWLTTYLGAPANALSQAFGALVLTAAARRVREPGAKFDQILVMIGPEGQGKSSAIETLAGRDCFSDQEILTLDERRQQEALQGVWLYEIGELAGLRRADVEKVTAFASRSVDRCRPAYGRARVDRPRRCVFVATTNETTFLKSQTGNRRFWPVETSRADLDALARDRDQLWGEAATIEARGGSLGLPSAFWEPARAEQMQRLDHDPWEDKLAGVTGRTASLADGKTYADDNGNVEARISSADILELELKIPADRMTDALAKRAAHIMRRLGWNGPDKMRIDGIPTRGYRRLG